LYRCDYGCVDAVVRYTNYKDVCSPASRSESAVDQFSFYGVETANKRGLS